VSERLTARHDPLEQDGSPEVGSRLLAMNRAIEAMLQEGGHAYFARRLDSRAPDGAAYARELRFRAGMELTIDPRQSLRTLLEARSISGSMDDPGDRVEQRARELMGRAHALGDVAVDEIEALLCSPDALAISPAQHLARSFLVPWLLVIGETDHARHWVATPVPRELARWTPWEARQRTIAEQHLRVADGRRPLPRATYGIRFDNEVDTISWLHHNVDRYWRFLDGDTSPSYPRVSRVDPSTRRPVNGHPYRALASAIEGLSPPVLELAPPSEPLSLYRIGRVLAAAEAVAIGSTRDGAIAWARWLDETWPAHVLRAPEWPVLVVRIRALLAARAGDAAGALCRMEEAIGIADAIAAPVEQAIARIQCAELVALDPRYRDRERWLELTREGGERSRELGIPHDHHAGRARTAATLGRFDLLRDQEAGFIPPTEPLTDRELQVIRLFSEGHTYREVGAILDIGWRTVQSHAYNAYQKLGVSSKIAAVAAVQRLDLI
jgi:DNA-binding CsgD family transcriptional regulator